MGAGRRLSGYHPFARNRCFCNVSIDDLPGVGKIEKEKKLNEYIDRDHELRQEGKIAESVKLWREDERLPKIIETLRQAALM